jgi:hypothetical protein
MSEKVQPKPKNSKKTAVWGIKQGNPSLVLVEWNRQKTTTKQEKGFP